MDVIGYGDADVDIYLTVDHLPHQDEKVLAEEYSFQKGGMVVNTIVALSRLGRSVGYHGKIGDDAFGQMAMENLKNHSIDTEGVSIKKGGHTYFCVVLIDPSGEKALVSAPTDCRERHPEDVSERFISRASHLHTTAIFPDVALKAINIAKAHGMTVSLDMDSGTVRSEEKLNKLLPNVDLLFLNEQGINLLRNGSSINETAKRLVSMGPKIVCVTQGKNGVLAANAQEVVHTEAFNVNVVDTTGAGDCFAAGFIHGFLSKWPLQFMSKFASAVAAISVMSYGGHSGAPTIDEVNKFLLDQGVA